jgi:hypothetical protein
LPPCKEFVANLERESLDQDDLVLSMNVAEDMEPFVADFLESPAALRPVTKVGRAEARPLHPNVDGAAATPENIEPRECLGWALRQEASAQGSRQWT